MRARGSWGSFRALFTPASYHSRCSLGSRLTWGSWFAGEARFASFSSSSFDTLGSWWARWTLGSRKTNNTRFANESRNTAYTRLALGSRWALSTSTARFSSLSIHTGETWRAPFTLIASRSCLAVQTSGSYDTLGPNFALGSRSSRRTRGSGKTRESVAAFTGDNDARGTRRTRRPGDTLRSYWSREAILTLRTGSSSSSWLTWVALFTWLARRSRPSFGAIQSWNSLKSREPWWSLFTCGSCHQDSVTGYAPWPGFALGSRSAHGTLGATGSNFTFGAEGTHDAR